MNRLRWSRHAKCDLMRNSAGCTQNLCTMNTRGNMFTSFVIEPDPEVECDYLVMHEKGIGAFCWVQHAFKVLADKATGVYKCECMQWHTSLFCMHVIKAFTHLQVQSIPNRYIPRHYTFNARCVVPWDRHGVRVTTHADTKQMRMSKLLP
jgi:hypothetical protein